MDVHEIGALAAKGNDQVVWECSCGSGGGRTTMLLVHMVAVVEAGEGLNLLFDRGGG